MVFKVVQSPLVGQMIYIYILGVNDQTKATVFVGGCYDGVMMILLW